MSLQAAPAAAPLATPPSPATPAAATLLISSRGLAGAAAGARTTASATSPAVAARSAGIRDTTAVMACASGSRCGRSCSGSSGLFGSTMPVALASATPAPPGMAAMPTTPATSPTVLHPWWQHVARGWPHLLRAPATVRHLQHPPCHCTVAATQRQHARAHRANAHFLQCASRGLRRHPGRNGCQLCVAHSKHVLRSNVRRLRNQRRSLRAHCLRQLSLVLLCREAGTS